MQFLNQILFPKFAENFRKFLTLDQMDFFVWKNTISAQNKPSEEPDTQDVTFFRIK